MAGDPNCPHNWIASNGVCICGYVPEPLGAEGSKHKHRFLYGGNVCTDCNATIIRPILTTDDPRCGKQEPGWFMGELAGPMGENPPLPIMLVHMWEINVAPPAPFIEEVSNLEKPTNKGDWLDIFTQWKAK